MTSHAAAERAALLDLLADAGPAGPTLIPPWTTHDLAAHLVVRETRPYAVPGMFLSPLQPLTAAVERRVRRTPYEDLLARLRSGPPTLSAGALSRGASDLHEFFVHHEDVRRVGFPGPRALSPALEDALWSRVRALGPGLTARAGLGITAERPDGTRARLRPGRDGVVVRGTPGEVLMWVFGRRDVAEVELLGDPSAVERARTCPLGW